GTRQVRAGHAGGGARPPRLCPRSTTGQPVQQPSTPVLCNEQNKTVHNLAQDPILLSLVSWRPNRAMRPTMTSPLWQRFLTQLAAGDSTAELEPVFVAERGLVWTICARIMGPGEDAEEAFQATWARVLADAHA